jgi:hypothetical protein
LHCYGVFGLSTGFMGHRMPSAWESVIISKRKYPVDIFCGFA